MINVGLREGDQQRDFMDEKTKKEKEYRPKHGLKPYKRRKMKEEKKKKEKREAWVSYKG